MRSTACEPAHRRREWNGRARRLSRVMSRLQESAMRPMFLLAAGLGLSACADVSIVHHSYYDSAYTPDHVQLAAASGTALAVIRNDPFPGDRDNAGVLAAMQ